jgi:hypothetical protein
VCVCVSLGVRVCMWCVRVLVVSWCASMCVCSLQWCGMVGVCVHLVICVCVYKEGCLASYCLCGHYLKCIVRVTSQGHILEKIRTRLQDREGTIKGADRCFGYINYSDCAQVHVWLELKKKTMLEIFRMCVRKCMGEGLILDSYSILYRPPFLYSQLMHTQTYTQTHTHAHIHTLAHV